MAHCSKTPTEMAVSPVKSLYWEQFPPMTQRRVYCTPVYHEGLIYVLGGCSETGMPLDSVEQQTPLASVEMYHPDEGKWEARASLGQPSMGVTTVEK
ncbi:hypothetical protein INR49_030613, partial [Caranx melampygus]